MFCCGSLSPELIRRQVDNTSWEPSEYEIMLIKATWSDNEDDLTELGASIYVYIFENYPKIHQHGENWKESKEFHIQGYIFAQVRVSLIECLICFLQRDLKKVRLHGKVRNGANCTHKVEGSIPRGIISFCSVQN
jgi:hypothetical protein